MVVGVAVFRYFQKDSIFPENSISYPPPWSAGCKSWNWRRPYPSRLIYVPNAADPAQTELAIFAYDNLAFYNLANHTFARCLTFETDSLVKLSPNGQLLAVAGPKGNVEIRQTETGAVLASLSTGEIKVMDMEFSPDSQTLAFLVGDSLRLWNAAQPTQPPRKLVSDVAYRPFAFSAADKTLAVVGYDKIQQWDIVNWMEQSTLSLPGSFEPAQGLFYTPDGQSLILWNSEGFVAMNLNDGGEIYRWIEYNMPQEYLSSISLSPDGRYLAVTGHSYTDGYYGPGRMRLPTKKSQLHLWRTDGWQYLGQILAETGDALAFSPDSRTLAADWDGKIRFMPMEELIPILKMPEE